MNSKMYNDFFSLVEENKQNDITIQKTKYIKLTSYKIILKLLPTCTSDILFQLNINLE